MSRISDTRIRTREAAAQLLASGRLAHKLTVDLIYAEIRQGSRTTINDELKLWKDEQTRNDALSAALPPDVANAMLSVWALAVVHGEQVFGQRSEELEAEAAVATTRADALEAAQAELQATVRAIRAQLDDQRTQLAALLTELAHAQAERDSALRQAEGAVTERDVGRAQSQQALHDARSAHARELEAVRTHHAQHEAALRAEVDQATFRLEGVQKHVMLQAEEAREAQRRAEAEVSETRQRNELLVSEIQQISADAAEHRRLATRHERQLASVTGEVRDLQRDRDALARQVALLQGQIKGREEALPGSRTRRSARKA
ncbi:DNA-binding protein [Caballeronia novacaledonica]|uniref:DNA-binding protein n=1 Tax=Caballeronia novacaledonica TaxID=1544861 RepID=A0ACB5R5N6_9BURK|nr:DNA-binding protein [Caballeronia sp. LZ029]MDR5746988.1 DNA-binding protein [Caballeronia sp. LZ029]GJH22664.1 DNA-binding protein [Caballeronia novacaledonica]